MVKINPIHLQAHAQISFTSANSGAQQPNPYNLINISTAKEAGDAARKQIGTMPYRIATAGYSAPPDGYEGPTRAFLEDLMNALGVRNTAFVTSPTADRGSIDAITSEAAKMSENRLFYVTAQDYVEYINPNNFPETIDTQAYSKIPKHVLPNGAEYSKATAEASNVFVATGGRNATVSDFCNAVKQGNKVVILNNPDIKAPAWGEAKGRVENASKYLLEQLEAFTSGRQLPHPEIGELTSKFLTKYRNQISELVRTVTLESSDPSAILNAAKTAARFIQRFH